MQTITLENECTIYEVAEKQQLIMSKWVGRNTDINFDLAAVTEIDVCFLQLLLSCKKTANEHNVSCELINLPNEVSNKIKAAHLTEHFTLKSGK